MKALYFRIIIINRNAQAVTKNKMKVTYVLFILIMPVNKYPTIYSFYYPTVASKDK